MEEQPSVTTFQNGVYCCGHSMRSRHISKYDLPTDSVEMVRVIRQRHYEETKDMTDEERREYRRKKVAEFEQYRKTVNPADYDFSWLKKKK